MTVIVKFIGALRHASGAGEIALNCTDNISMRELMRQITKENPALTRSLLDQQLADATPNVLILVNGREISVLNSLETKLRNGDEVVLVPVIHGG